jgi:hypothetical protein
MTFRDLSLMNRRKLTIGLKKKLRDPIWQSIGVFLTLIALITPLIIARFLSSPAPQSSNRILFSSETSRFLTENVSEPVTKRMRFLIDGKEEQDLRLFIFTIDYRGKDPIRSADFETPIRGHVPIHRKIIGVQKSSNLEGPYRFDRETGEFGREKRPPISFEVEILDEQTFQIKPVLMNPGEWLGVEIYTAAAKDTSPAPPTDPVEKYKVLSSEVRWDCHVAGVQCPGTVDLNVDLGDPLGEDVPWFLSVAIRHEGLGVYLILLFTIISLLLMVLLAKSIGLQKAAPITQIFLFSIAVALSMASAEVASDWLITDRILGIAIDVGQPVYAYVILWLDIAVIIFLAAMYILKRKNKRARLQRPVQPEEEEN